MTTDTGSSAVDPKEQLFTVMDGGRIRPLTRQEWGIARQGPYGAILVAIQERIDQIFDLLPTSSSPPPHQQINDILQGSTIRELLQLFAQLPSPLRPYCLDTSRLLVLTTKMVSTRAQPTPRQSH